jgi:hypothetical protein
VDRYLLCLKLQLGYTQMLEHPIFFHDYLDFWVLEKKNSMDVFVRFSVIWNYENQMDVNMSR